MFSILNRSFKLPQCGHRGSSASVRSSNSNAQITQRNRCWRERRSRRRRFHSPIIQNRNTAARKSSR